MKLLLIHLPDTFVEQKKQEGRNSAKVSDSLLQHKSMLLVPPNDNYYNMFYFRSLLFTKYNKV
jgi:hypothetical protein